MGGDSNPILTSWRTWGASQDPPSERAPGRNPGRPKIFLHFTYSRWTFLHDNRKYRLSEWEPFSGRSPLS